MRKILLALCLCSTPVLADPPAKKPPAKVEPVKFPVPKDATGGESQPGGGGKILMYQVARGRDVVLPEVRGLLKTDGWTVTKDDPSPSGRAIRLEVKKGDTLIKVSFVGDATRTAIIVTLP